MTPTLNTIPLPLRGALTAMALACASLMGGCGFGDGGGNNVIITPVAPAVAVQTTVISGVVVDATSGAALASGSTSLSIGGTGALLVVDGAGQAVTTLTSSNGTFLLAAKAGTVPSTAAPLEFTLSLTRSGYVPITQKVSLTSTGTTAVEVRMASAQADSTGKVTVAADNAGQQTKPVVTTAADAGKFPTSVPGADFTAKATLITTAAIPAAEAVSASVTIPVGVVGSAVDANGVKVAAAAGQSTVQVVTGSIKSLGGLSTVEPVAANAAAAPVAFAAFASFDVIDSKGQRITQFDAPITLSLNMLGVTRNLSVTPSRLYAVNDTVPIYNFDEPTAKWVKTGTGTVRAKDAATGLLAVDFQTSHLTTFAALPDAPPTCAQSLTVTAAAGDTRKFTVREMGFFEGVTVLVEQAYNGTFVTQMPTGGQITGEVKNAATGELVASFNGAACTAVAANPLTVTLAAPPATGTVTVNVSEVCSNDATVTTPLATSVSLFNSSQILLGSGYTGATGSFTVSGIATGATRVTASNPRTTGAASAEATATVLANQTVTVPLSFPVQCRALTGAG